MFQRILVAVDPSPTRHSAVRTAGELARLTGATVHVLHVVASAAAFDTVVRLEDDAEAEAVLGEALAALRAKGIGADGELVRAMVPEVAPVISAAAERFKADLVVISPHHRGALAALFNPRVSDAVAHASRIAVLLAPEDDGQQD
ncbi:universal stress protein [Streptomyces sp. SAI-229]|jgi:nucleotide-binding universal stress UspA family protein|uniref:universal stress protein n=1 Tax=Streptomyces sp. SAI-229 TaxID=3377731 RepID=UPI003C7CD562